MFIKVLLQGDAVSFIREILGSPIGSFTFVLGIMILAGWLIYFVTKNITKYKTEREVDRSRVNSVESSVESVKSDIAYIKGNINILLRIFDEKSPIQSKSPVTLSAIGIDLAKRMQLKERITANWNKISRFLDDNILSKNAYDIQQLCIDTASVSLDKFFSNEDIDYFKDFAFKEGKPLIYYGGMIGVMIRDTYFLHKGIDVSEIDKHAPQEH